MLFRSECYGASRWASCRGRRKAGRPLTKEDGRAGGLTGKNWSRSPKPGHRRDVAGRAPKDSELRVSGGGHAGGRLGQGVDEPGTGGFDIGPANGAATIRFCSDASRLQLPGRGPDRRAPMIRAGVFHGTACTSFHCHTDSHHAHAVLCAALPR